MPIARPPQPASRALRALVSIMAVTLPLALLGPAAAALHAQSGPKDLVLVSGLPESDPMEPLVTAVAHAIGDKIGKEPTMEYYGQGFGIKAAAKLSLSEPDGLTLGFLPINTVLAPGMANMAPYRGEHFLPVAIGFEHTHVLLAPEGSPISSFSALRDRKGKGVTLVTPAGESLSASNLLALDLLETLGVPASIRELAPAAKEEGSGKDAEKPEAPEGQALPGEAEKPADAAVAGEAPEPDENGGTQGSQVAKDQTASVDTGPDAETKGPEGNGNAGAAEPALSDEPTESADTTGEGEEEPPSAEAGGAGESATPDGGEGLVWYRYLQALRAAGDGELVSIPIEALGHLQSARQPFQVVAALSDHPEHSPLIPEEASLKANGVALRAHDLMGFFYVGGTTPRLMGEAPEVIREVCERAYTQGLAMGPMWVGDEALKVFADERSQREAILAKLDKPGTPK
ncbi:MAG: hypothetical protein LBF40_09335 [Deltaproteobacteria bacterium]|jgi:hypothetical protein|nr:hypothetical protein [Deltaproteobacteria bacterium]